MKRCKKEVADADFLAARACLMEVAAFLDRADRADGAPDARVEALKGALKVAAETTSSRAATVLNTLSYQDTTVPESVAGKSACGAPVPQQA